MIVNAEDHLKNRPFEIDLRGPEGNVFVLIGHATRMARKMGLDPDEIASDMMSSDYEHAVSVFDKHFGQHVILIR